MSKSILRFGVAVYAALLFSACFKESNVETSVKQYDTFLASIDEGSTKVHLENDVNVRWDLSEQIAIFSDLHGPIVYTRDEDGKFRGEPIQGNTFYAYPIGKGSPEISLSDTEPFVLNCNKLMGFFGEKKTFLPMVAKSYNNHLLFKQTGGIMHFRIQSENTLLSAYLFGNERESVCGPAIVSLEEENPTLKLTDEEYWLNMTADCPDDLCNAGEWDIYFYLPPMTFSSGFLLKVYSTDCETGETVSVDKISNKSFTIQRGRMLSFPLFNLNAQQDDEVSELAREREILVKLYDATDGDNWTNNTNWCTDSPLSSWYGIETAIENHVTAINLELNNLRGELPSEVWSLPFLKKLDINNNSLTIRIPAEESALSGSIELLDLGNYDMMGMGGNDAVFVEERNNIIVGGIPSSVAKLKRLTYCYAQKTELTGTIPDEIWLPSLQVLWLGDNNLEGELSAAIGHATSLTEILLTNNRLYGEIPEEIGNLAELVSISFGNTSLNREGTLNENCNRFTKLPSSIGNLKKLKNLFVEGNELRGGLPASLFECESLVQIGLGNPVNGKGYYNDFDCELPEDLGKLTNLEYLSIYSSGIKGPLPSSFGNLEKLSFCDLSGTYGHVDAFNSINGPLPDISQMKKLSAFYLDNNYFEGNIPEHYATLPNLELHASNNCLSGLLSDSIIQAPNFSKWVISPQRDGYGLKVNSVYESSDYSRDGKVIEIQKASVGNGINIVIMGDAFADYEIKDGTYDNIMREGIKQFFAIEPYASFKNHFNVYEVEVVSKNNVYMGQLQETALGTIFGDGTLITGNDQKCMDYASASFNNEQDWEEVLIIVLLNRKYYAGTCKMYHVTDHDRTGVNYGNGFAIAYLPLGTDDDMFRGLIQHEAGGHGFAKLADEYFYDSGGYFDTSFYQATVGLNWYPNIDVTSDPNSIKWHEFLTDSRYSDEGVGIYEGGATIPNGIWRPTENSIMRFNTGEYNAPSRRAIWKRINMLSYGNEFDSSYAAFVSYDQSARKNSSASAKPLRVPSSIERRYPPLNSPIVHTIDKSYLREILKRKAGKNIYIPGEASNRSADNTVYTYTIGRTCYLVEGDTVRSYTVD